MSESPQILVFDSDEDVKREVEPPLRSESTENREHISIEDLPDEPERTRHLVRCCKPEAVEAAATRRLSSLLTPDLVGIKGFVKWAMSPLVRRYHISVVSAVKRYLPTVMPPAPSDPLLAAWRAVHGLLLTKGVYLDALQPDLPRLVALHMPKRGALQAQAEFLRLLLDWEKRSLRGSLLRRQTLAELEPHLAYRFMLLEPRRHHLGPSNDGHQLEELMLKALRWSQHGEELIQGLVDGLQGVPANLKLPYWVAMGLVLEHGDWFVAALAPHLPLLLRHHACPEHPRFQQVARAWLDQSHFPSLAEALQDLLPVPREGSPDGGASPGAALAPSTDPQLEEHIRQQWMAVRGRDVRLREAEQRAAVGAAQRAARKDIADRCALAGRRWRFQPAVSRYRHQVTSQRKPAMLLSIPEAKRQRR